MHSEQLGRPEALSGQPGESDPAAAAPSPAAPRGKDIWILGASGRIGRAVAARLLADGQTVTLVGRDQARLTQVSATLNGRFVLKEMTGIADMAASIARERPAIVLNLVGPFVQTALPIARACPPGTHYVDLSNELPSIQALQGLHVHASRAGSTFVTGAGFGVLATESVVLQLCEGLPPARRVRSAAIPAVASEPGPLGAALAASITEGLALGGRRYENGHLVRASLMGDFERLELPDGRLVGTASAPSGELEAVRRASGADDAVATTSMVPPSALLRALLPALLAVFKVSFVRRFAARRIAAIEVKPSADSAPQVSWAHAQVKWYSGLARHGWLRTGDAMVFTADVMARVAIRLNQGDGKPGVYTPGALFGAELAVECGARIMLGEETSH